MTAEQYPEAVQRPLTAKLATRGPMARVSATSAHTAASEAAGAELGAYFAKAETKADSHFYIERSGQVFQYVPVGTVAWAQVAGNDHVVSYETQGDGDQPWTPAQLDAIGRLLVWLRIEWGVPTTPATAANGPGAAYHSQFPSWNPDHHDCPGPERTAQLADLLTHLNTQEPTVPTTPQAKAVALLRPSGGEGYAIVTEDGAVFAYGGCPFFGSLGGKPLAAPIVGATWSQGGLGYWLLGADGGVFGFGDARYYGSIPDDLADGALDGKLESNPSD